MKCGMRGTRKRNSQDFPASGLRWPVKFQEGENHVRVVARKGSEEVSDEIRFLYQTAKWDKPAKLDLREIARKEGIVTVETRLFDAKGVQCLDARQRVRFSLAGDGLLLDNLGTSRGSREVELYNGRAMISFKTNGGVSQVSVASKDVPTVFLKIEHSEQT